METLKILSIIGGIISLLLAIIFVVSKYNNIVGAIIIIINFILLLIYGFKRRNKIMLIYLYIVLFFTFYWISNVYKDNYSIRALIKELNLRENDRLDFEFEFVRDEKQKVCLIKGNYKHKILKDKDDEDVDIYNLINITEPKTKKENCCDLFNHFNTKFVYGENNKLSDSIEVDGGRRTEMSYDKLKYTCKSNEESSSVFKDIIIFVIILLIFSFIYNVIWSKGIKKIVKTGDNKLNKQILQASDIKVN